MPNPTLVISQTSQPKAVDWLSEPSAKCQASPIDNCTRVTWMIAGVIFCSMSLLMWLIARHPDTDIHAHALYLQHCLKSQSVPDALLFYLVVSGVTQCSTNLGIIRLAIGVVLGAAISARFLCSIRTLKGWPVSANTTSPLALLALALVGLVFCLPVPGESWFASQFAPNVWHNSTCLFLMPLAVVLFNASMDFLTKGKTEPVLKLTLLAILNVLIKPSFFLCFAPIFPLAVLCTHRSKRSFLRSLIPVVAGLFVLAGVYRYIYSSSEFVQSGIAFSYFRVWSYFTNNIPLAIINSLLLPLAFLLVYPKESRNELSIRYAVALLTFGLVIYGFVQETGPREFHGNLWWQLPVCNYLVHVTVYSAFLRTKTLTSKWLRRDWFLASVFIIEAVAGLVYLLRIVLTGNFL